MQCTARQLVSLVARQGSAQHSIGLVGSIFDANPAFHARAGSASRGQGRPRPIAGRPGSIGCYLAHAVPEWAELPLNKVEWRKLLQRIAL
jgi:hypothetical protein